MPGRTLSCIRCARFDAGRGPATGPLKRRATAAREERPRGTRAGFDAEKPGKQRSIATAERDALGPPRVS